MKSEEKILRDICYSGEQCLDVYLPDSDSFPVVVYFHGGGLEAGDKADPQVFIRDMVKAGVAVVSANYRMYPRAKYPEFIEDAADAVAWTFANMGKYGNVEGICVGGSSAGGYLSQMLCFDSSRLEGRGLSPMSVSGFVHDAGQPTCHYNVLRERGIDPCRVIVDEAGPLYHVGSAENYPPMLVIVSDQDMANRYEQTMLLVSALRHLGHEGKVQLQVMHGRHCAYVNAVDAHGDSVLGSCVRSFLEKTAKR